MRQSKISRYEKKETMGDFDCSFFLLTINRKASWLHFTLYCAIIYAETEFSRPNPILRGTGERRMKIEKGETRRRTFSGRNVNSFLTACGSVVSRRCFTVTALERISRILLPGWVHASWAKYSTATGETSIVLPSLFSNSREKRNHPSKFKRLAGGAESFSS